MIMNFPTYGQVCIIITYENVMKGFVNSFAIFPWSFNLIIWEEVNTVNWFLMFTDFFSKSLKMRLIICSTMWMYNKTQTNSGGKIKIFQKQLAVLSKK